MSEFEIIAGIDLGTTNSAIGILEDGLPRLIEIDGNLTMPSCVGIGPSGEVLVGQPALNQLAAAPERTVVSIKRRMGSESPIKLGDHEYRPEELSAFILKRLKQEAERQLGRPVTKAVVTVPAYFDEKQRRATQDAAELAGLEAVRILNEPTAAALSYNLQKEGSQTIMVYDLGGGTFDVSLVFCEKGLVEVKASHGDTHLGGDDFDELLVGHLAKGWTGKTPLDLEDPRTNRRLKIAAEAAKCRLSDHAFARVREDFLTADSHLDIEVPREELEALIAPLLSKTWDSMHAALRDGGVQTRQIDKILLVGGSTRIPLVRRMIEECIGRAPSAEVNPDLVVALGAAIQGGIIAGQDAGSILVDIATHTFSTSALEMGTFEEICVPVIPRGSPLPVTRSEAFETVDPCQEKVLVEVFQGESDVPDENLRIGEFVVEGLSEAPAGNVILCQFALDLNGLLEVTAIEKSTGLSKSVTIDTRDVEASFDLAEARQRIAAAFGEEETDPPVRTTPAGESDHDRELVRAKELKKRVEKLGAGNLGDDDRQDLEQLLDASLTAIKHRDPDALRECSDQLEDILFYLED